MNDHSFPEPITGLVSAVTSSTNYAVGSTIRRVMDIDTPLRKLGDIQIDASRLRVGSLRLAWRDVIENESDAVVLTLIHHAVLLLII